MVKGRRAKKVKDIRFDGRNTVDGLVESLGNSGGFTAKKVAIAVDILQEMVEDEKCHVFASFPACIIATGTRGVICELVKQKMVDTLVTTCGTLDHDLARIWKDYYHGSFEMDDKELLDEDIHRLGNILVPKESYGVVLERKLQPILKRIWKEGGRRVAPYELIWKIGAALEKEKKREESILYWCHKNEIPVFVPGILDGAVGCQMWMFYQEHKDFQLDMFADEQALSDIVFDAKKTGALMIGGGISKHHTIWWNQFRDGLDKVVYITTAVEHDGSLSGARVREGISWGKVSAEANYTTVEGDATVLLPLMVAGLLERMRKR